MASTVYSNLRCLKNLGPSLTVALKQSKTKVFRNIIIFGHK